GLARFDSAPLQVARRYVRLAIPYAVALLVAVLVAALVRPWFAHPSVPAEPSLPQLLANALLLQDIVGEEALSAGVWYVAIDFQLFALLVLLLAGVRALPGLAPGQRVLLVRVLVVAGTAASLLVFNRHSGLDMWALYFMGAYGLGVMAFWAVGSSRPALWLGGMAVLGALALTLDFRARILVALVSALGLAWALRRPWSLPAVPAVALLQRLGQMSYSVFLVHFPVCLLVNALVHQVWPTAVWANALGMLAAFGLSLAAGRLLYRTVERPAPTWALALRWQASLVGAGMLVALSDGVL
ncbi:MAG: acyltransferase family protein, partial [Gammaproteobacteria bacterium]